MNQSINVDLKNLRRHILLEVPCSFINGMPHYFYTSNRRDATLKKSYFKYLRFKLADWISGGKLSEIAKWYNELLRLLAILTMNLVGKDINEN